MHSFLYYLQLEFTVPCACNYRLQNRMHRVLYWLRLEITLQYTFNKFVCDLLLEITIPYASIFISLIRWAYKTTGIFAYNLQLEITKPKIGTLHKIRI